MTLTRDEVLAILRKDNPRARLDVVSIYADSYRDYHEAADNIAEHGTVVAHPRTGQPIDNPYVKVKAAAITTLTKVGGRLKVDRLWSAPTPEAK